MSRDSRSVRRRRVRKVLVRYRRAWLYPKQEEFLYDPARFVVCEASTKSGKTYGCIVRLHDEAVRNGGVGRKFWWVAPIRAQAKIAFDRWRRVLKAGSFAVNLSDMTLTLGNGSIIEFKSADHPDSLYGDDVFAVVIDESTRCKADAWVAIRTTLTATNGRAWIIGNVRGRKNWSYRLARMAEAGEPDFAYYRLTADDAIAAGIFPASELASAERSIGNKDLFRQLYFAEAADDDLNPFGLQAIAGCIRNEIVYGPDGRQIIDGQRVPDEALDAYGVDLGKRVNWTVLAGLAGNVQAHFERYQRSWNRTKVDVRATVGVVTPTLVDETGVGDPVLEAVQEGRDNVRGFTFSGRSRPELLSGLAVAISEGSYLFPEGPLAVELREFEYVHTPTGVRWAVPEGIHDDSVMAAALAVEQRRLVRRYPSAGGAQVPL